MSTKANKVDKKAAVRSLFANIFSNLQNGRELQTKKVHGKGGRANAAGAKKAFTKANGTEKAAAARASFP